MPPYTGAGASSRDLIAISVSFGMTTARRRVAGHLRSRRSDAADSAQWTGAQLIEKVSVVAAPVTVLTALFVYFGFVRTSAFYGYFGVNMHVLKLSVQDYVLSSVGVSFGAVARLALAGALLITLDQCIAIALARRAVSNREMRTVLRWTLIASGLALITLGLISAVSRTVVAVLDPLIGSALLALGAIVVLRFGSTLLTDRGGRSGRRATVLTAIALVISGFWVTTIYAQSLGLEAAQHTDALVGKLPLVSVFSTEAIDLPGTDVSASRITFEDQKYRYRYTGLSLLTYSNDRWFVITGRLSDEYRSSVAILKDSDAIRVEVAAGVNSGTAR
ncbi:MAG: hypothetical protein ACRDRG_10310 [Pseudonocardiaceae bacterium]